MKDEFEHYKITYTWGVLPGITRTASPDSSVHQTAETNKEKETKIQ